jgi:hypothetical protein
MHEWQLWLNSNPVFSLYHQTHGWVHPACGNQINAWMAIVAKLSTLYFHYIIDSWVHLALVAKLYPIFHYFIDSWVHPACGNHVETNLSVGIPYMYYKSSCGIGYLRGFLSFFIQAKVRDMWTFFFFFFWFLGWIFVFKRLVLTMVHIPSLD